MTVAYNVRYIAEHGVRWRQVVGGEETGGPFLGELESLAEHDRDCGPADMRLGEPVGDHGGRIRSSLNSCEYRAHENDRNPGQGVDVGNLVA